MKSECECPMTIRLLGDGCSVCNPEMAAQILADNLAEDEDDLGELDASKACNLGDTNCESCS